MKTFTELRKAMGVSQEKFSAYLGIHRVALSNLETGAKKPTKQQAKALKLLDVVYRHGLLSELEKGND